MLNKSVDKITEAKIRNLNNDILDLEQRIAHHQFQIQKLLRKIDEIRKWN